MAIDKQQSLYGLMAEFETPETLKTAVEKTRRAGYRDIEAYTPFPVEGLHDIIYENPSRLPHVVLLGGLLGAATGFGLQVYLNAIEYPINVGGRPLFSWPAFIPITFELTILFAAFGAFFGVLIANHFPAYYHPVFNVDAFERASQDRFFLTIQRSDRQFEAEETEQFLRALEPEPMSVSKITE